MHGQRIGYIRVSTLDQHTERQLEHSEVFIQRLKRSGMSGRQIARELFQQRRPTWTTGSIGLWE